MSEPKVIGALRRAAKIATQEARAPRWFGMNDRDALDADAVYLDSLARALAKIVATKAELAPVGETSLLREHTDWTVAVIEHATPLASLLTTEED